MSWNSSECSLKKSSGLTSTNVETQSRTVVTGLAAFSIITLHHNVWEAGHEHMGKCEYDGWFDYIL